MNNAPTPVLAAQGVVKRFHDGKIDVTVLQGIDLQVLPGQALAIVGASGSGKSTLLHILGGLDAPTQGRVWWQGQPCEAWSTAELGRQRNQHIGFVYQFHHLLPEFTAIDNVAMPLLIRRLPMVQAREQAAIWLDKVGLVARLEHRPAELSGGERQRVAVARALVAQPRCILADEPTGNLDRSSAANVFDLLLNLAQESSTAVIVVTHDAELAQRCGRVMHMNQGRLSL
jgi:lipoprotein-releasing system ATP-binding protein